MLAFYGLLDQFAAAVGGPHTLASCNGRFAWPRRGIYFFFESGETRTHGVDGARVVRVGTHALTAGSSSTLWGRLSQHRGQAKSGGGNHRGSIFRLIVGASLIERKSYCFPTWGQGSSGLYPRRVMIRSDADGQSQQSRRRASLPTVCWPVPA